jgi:hypothetical protein
MTSECLAILVENALTSSGASVIFGGVLFGWVSPIELMGVEALALFGLSRLRHLALGLCATEGEPVRLSLALGLLSLLRLAELP